ncbi:DNA helicase [Candidatus Desulfarcum epimagneticum]|uniref:DNA 3'-5' helicase n=1 Tax=uncultured Desulfobacteraceae bacterium TaxID=218296 RepID=A0A484HJZ0_9BACT|nr:DNA helicase [uncultured Desulfobacteraceae bacterium]
MENQGPSNFKIQYEKELNPSQLEAVFFSNGPLLVIAGAGSGKTRTIIYRVARLVEDGISPASILLLTFTKKAAAQMLGRASSLLDRRCADVAGGTFHSFANAMLRRYGPEIGLPRDFTIMDRGDSESLIGMIKKEMESPLDGGRFPANRTLMSLFSRAVNKSAPLEETLLGEYPHFKKFLEPIAAMRGKYDAYKAEHACVDYDDLLALFLRLLKESPGVRDRISDRLANIMVDEYQDTNPMQAEIVSLLAGERRNIMAVGDDSQSIYGFRGADIRNMLRFPETFPGTRIIRLEENYRSGPAILDLTNTVIDQASEKFSKTLFTQKTGGMKPVLAAMKDERDQSRYVVRQIRRLLDKGVRPGSVAILFRAGFHSYDLEIELTKNRLSFVKSGGFKFVEASHIKDLISHLRVLANPLDRISWHRALLLLDRVGLKTAQKIYDALEKNGDGLAGLDAISLSAAASPGFEALKAMLLSVTESPGASVSRMGEIVLGYYMPLLKKKYDDYPKRARDLEHMMGIMERYDSLPDFLNDMALEPPNSSSLNGALSEDGEDNDVLTLSTIHSAKGLEWSHVFVIWALDGRFPSMRAIEDDENLEEELRLMYVAATRAKKNLFITYPMRHYDRGSGFVLDRPTRFLENVPDDILERRFPPGMDPFFRERDWEWED